MKNIAENKIKKCIVVEQKVIEKIVKETTGENVFIDSFDGEIYFETQYSNDHDLRYFKSLIANEVTKLVDSREYYDVKIVSMHCTGDTGKCKVWIEFA